MPPYQYGNPANDFYLRQAQQLSQQYPYQQNHQQYQPNFQQPLNFPAYNMNFCPLPTNFYVAFVPDRKRLVFYGEKMQP